MSPRPRLAAFVRRSLISAAGAVLLAMPATAQVPSYESDVPWDEATYYYGACTLTIDGRAAECHDLVYQYSTGAHRATLNVASGSGGVGFSGTDYDMPEQERYNLRVDSFYDALSNPRQAVRSPATGSCVARMTGDGNTFLSVTCDARTEVGRVHVVWRNSGRAPRTYR